MSLNCLTCQTLQRTNSDSERRNQKQFTKLCREGVERSWSGNLSPLPYEKNARSSLSGSSNKVKKGHRRIHSTSAIAFGESREPRLVRSSGMRRDWSFENLREIVEDKEEGTQF